MQHGRRITRRRGSTDERVGRRRFPEDAMRRRVESRNQGKLGVVVVVVAPSHQSPMISSELFETSVRRRLGRNHVNCANPHTCVPPSPRRTTTSPSRSSSSGCTGRGTSGGIAPSPRRNLGRSPVCRQGTEAQAPPCFRSARAPHRLCRGP